MECCSNDTISPTTTTAITMTMSHCSINVTSTSTALSSATVTSTALCGTTVTSCPTLNITTVISTNFNTITTTSLAAIANWMLLLLLYVVLWLTVSVLKQCRIVCCNFVIDSTFGAVSICQCCPVTLFFSLHNGIYTCI